MVGGGSARRSSPGLEAQDRLEVLSQALRRGGRVGGDGWWPHWVMVSVGCTPEFSAFFFLPGSWCLVGHPWPFCLTGDWKIADTESFPPNVFVPAITHSTCQRFLICQHGRSKIYRSLRGLHLLPEGVFIASRVSGSRLQDVQAASQSRYVVTE